MSRGSRTPCGRVSPGRRRPYGHVWRASPRPPGHGHAAGPAGITAGPAGRAAEDLAVHRGRRHRRSGAGRGRGDRRRPLGLLGSAYGRAGPRRGPGRPGGTDHGGVRADAPVRRRVGRRPPAPSAASVLTGLGGTATAARSAPAGQALAGVLGPAAEEPGARHAAPPPSSTSPPAKRLYGAGRRGGAHPRLDHEDRHRCRRALRAWAPTTASPPARSCEPDTERARPGRRRRPHAHRPQDGPEGSASLRDARRRDGRRPGQKRGVRQVTLSYDTTLYTGPDAPDRGQRQPRRRSAP